MKHLLSIVFIFLLFSCSIQAQFKWSFADKTFSAGDTVQAQCWVSGFDSIGAFQYSLAYDTNHLSIRLDTPFTFTGLVPYTREDFSHGLQEGLSSLFYYPKNHIKTMWADPFVHTYSNGHVYTIWFIAKDRGTVCESIYLLDGPNDMDIEAWHENLIDPIEMQVGCIPERFPQWAGPTQEEEIRVYPNPSSDVIFVDSTEPVEVMVMNSVGEIIFHDRVYSADQSIPIDYGINLVKIVTQDITITRQVIKLN